MCCSPQIIIFGESLRQLDAALRYAVDISPAAADRKAASTEEHLICDDPSVDDLMRAVNGDGAIGGVEHAV